MSVITKYCDGCHYRQHFTSGGLPYCNYLCSTGHKRPCPAGDGCTVRVLRKVYRKRVRTDAEKIEFREKELERQRRKQKAYYERHKEEISAKAREKRLAKCGC